MTCPQEPTADSRLRIPVTVLLSRRIVSRGRWSTPVWDLAGVLVGDQLTHQPRAGQRVRQGDDNSADSTRTYSWSGHGVMLYKDAAERYWHALIGDKPRVYVLCRDARANDGDPLAAEIEPSVVSVDYDAALASVETDQTVVSGPIPGELYKAMETFVLQHYRPTPFTKRKRRQWSRDPRAGAPGGDAGGGVAARERRR